MIKMNELKFELIPVEIGSDIYFEIMKMKQEYVKVSYSGHKHLPIVFRIHLKKYSELLKYGNAPYIYANIWLDDIYDIMLREKLDYIWYAGRIWETYFHEFFHIYFFSRLEHSDMIGYKIRSKRWGWNERIINIFTNIFSVLFIEMMDDEQFEDWFKIFEDVK